MVDDEVFYVTWTLARRLRVAALAMLLYDYVLTWEQERRLFWKRRRSWVTVLFFWNRYIGIGVTIFGTTLLAVPRLSDSLCVVWLRSEGAIGMGTAWAVQLILQLRIYALYRRSRLVGCVTLVCWVLQMAYIVPFLWIATSGGKIIAQTKGEYQRCIITPMLPTVVAAWGVLMCYEGLLLTLTINKAFEYYKIRRATPNSVRSIQGVIIRDSILYSLFIGMIYGVNIFLWGVDSSNRMDMLMAFSIALPSLLASRLMLNVRDYSTQHTIFVNYAADNTIPIGGMSTDIQTRPLPELEFA
ncbi:hypothetical protein BDN72DRAFT_843401 [Pluteus cervinus]|uniref:Uncharacterized protein n=1 Tax=Pluteus cervinus TaxID=181527 RepID=A0ACD3AMS0_9AGAR|nr:hypothetical protein BDN72DRAFT_843401 [Pluteus cervinus]